MNATPAAMGLDSDFLSFVGSSHNPRLERRGTKPHIDVHIRCACGKQTPWRKNTRRLLVQADWVTHVREERARWADTDASPHGNG